jgi:hypothetical protein
VDQAGPVDIRGGYPNPFKETGHYIVVLKADGTVEFAVFNVAGEIIYIEKKPLPAGVSIWDWDGVNDARARLASGIYIIRAKDLDAAGPPVYFMTAITR